MVPASAVHFSSRPMGQSCIWESFSPSPLSYLLEGRAVVGVLGCSGDLEDLPVAPLISLVLGYLREYLHYTQPYGHIRRVVVQILVIQRTFVTSSSPRIIRGLEEGGDCVGVPDPRTGQLHAGLTILKR